MGKTPERAAQRSSAVRYRRKVEVVGDNQRDAKSERSARSEDGGDNQREHEAAVAPLKKQLGRKKSQPKQHFAKKDTRRSLKRSDGGPTAGKPFEDIKAPEKEDAEPVEAHREPEAVVDVADAESNNSVTTDNSSVAPATSRPTDYQQERRNQKIPKRRTKHLVWRVKAQQAQQGAAVEASVEPASSGLPVSKPAVDDVDDEAEFTMRERQLLKNRSKEVSYPLESSSQETQSGSDDDSTFLQFAIPLVRSSVPSSAPIADEAEISNAIDDFPEPFPMGLIGALPSSRVHEVVINDYSFQPEQLKISAGDVVVWHVSDSTPQMVEHCLLAKLTLEVDEAAISSVTPTLNAGDRFAWRFNDVGTVSISCTVYGMHGSIVVASPTKSPVVYKRAQRSNQLIKKPKKWKKRRNSPHPTVNGQVVTDARNGSDEGEVESVEVFHCPPQLLDHSEYPDMDIALRDAVLSQLDVVANAAISGVNASTGLLPVIVVGDVACPVLEDAQEDVQEDVIATSKLCDAEVVEEPEDQVADFQERVIAMLKRSEESLARHRRSFAVDGSGFDAEGAYDFLKRRFMQTQSSGEHIVYY